MTRSNIAYATGGLAMNLMNLVISQWIYKCYAGTPETTLVPIFWLGLIFLAGRLTDGITDPLVAYWSDQCRSQSGRRLPFIRWSLLPLAIVFVLLWIPPVAGLSWVNSLWAFVFIQAYFIGYTLVVTPYLALLPEITRNLDERVTIATWQAVFALIGTVIFSVLGLVIGHWGWLAMGLLVGVLCLVSFGPTVLFVKEAPLAEASGEATPGIWAWVLMTMKNRSFVILLAATSFYWFGLNLLIMLVPFWVQDFLGLGESQVAALMGPFLISNLVFFFLFNLWARRSGKWVVMLFTFLGSAIAVPALLLAGHLPWGSALFQSAVAMGLIGIPAAGFMMLPFALLSDVVDYDEQITGQRREGIYFGVQAIFQKSMIGLSIVVFGWVAFDSSGNRLVLEGLRSVPWYAAVAFVIAFALFLVYPLREKNGSVHHIGGGTHS